MTNTVLHVCIFALVDLYYLAITKKKEKKKVWHVDMSSSMHLNLCQLKTDVIGCNSRSVSRMYVICD